MSKESDRVIAGFMRLTSDERRQVVEAINDYQNKGMEKRGELQKMYEMKAGVDTGPLGSGRCPCCGR